MARQNLLTFSEQFDSSNWNKSNTTVSANLITAPDGNLTADGILSNTTSSILHRCSNNFAFTISSTITVSCYFKAGAVSWAMLNYNSLSSLCYFNLSGAGAVGSSSSIISASIVSVGNGWYRCSMTYFGLGSIGISPANADNSSTYAASDTTTPQIYAWGGQLVQANWAGDYVQTTTTALGLTTPPRNLVVSNKQNLILQSETIENASWARAGTSVSANQIANPIDGAVTADAILATSTGSANHRMNQTEPTGIPVGTTCTFSAYLKAGFTAWVFLNGPGSPGGSFNLVGAGTASTFTGGATGTITALANGWYRCTLTYVRGNSGNMIIGGSLSASVEAYAAPDTTSAQFYVYGAQYVQANQPGDYIATTTAKIGIATPPRNIINPNSQNLLTFSEQFDNAIWTKSLCSISANAIAAPDGTLTADGILATSTASSTHRSLQNFPAATTYTFSVYLKAGAVSWAQLIFNSSGTTAYFNLSGAGSIGTSNAISNSIVSVGNGWYRCVSTIVSNAGGNYGFQPANADLGATYATSDTTTPQIYAWGAQLVQANWEGDYVQTTTTTVNPTLRLRNKLTTNQNLILQSESFNSTWTTSNLNISPDVTANPITGTITADGVIATGTTSVLHRVLQPLGGTIGYATTFSVYAKAGAVSWIQLVPGNTGALAFFNLSGAGSVGTTAGTPFISAAITNVGGGWYRCSITSTKDASGQTSYIATANADNSSTFAAADSTSVQVYLWGAQYVQSNWAGPYTPTTTAAIGSTTPIRKAVPTQQNLLLQSQTFNITWTQSNASLIANATTAPDGTLTAYKLIDSVSNTGHSITQQPTTGNVITCSSIYVKAAERTVASLYTFGRVPLDQGSGYTPFNVNLLTGAVSTVQSNPAIYSVVSVGNGWWRISAANPISSSGSVARQFGISTLLSVDSAGGGAYIGDGASGIYVWGAQLVQGSQPGDYVATTTSTVNSGILRNLS